MIKIKKKDKRRRQIRPDYHKKSLRNPFYKPKEEKSSETKLRSILWFIVALLVIGASIWLFLFSNYFKIKALKIDGLTILEKFELENLVFKQAQDKKLLIFKKDNFFIFSKKDLKEEILNKYNFADLEIKKSLPNSLELKIIERPYAFIYQDGDNFYYSSADGYIIKEVPVKEEDKLYYFILENQSLAIKISTRNKLNLSSDFLNFALKTAEELKNYPNLLSDKLIIDQELNSLIISLKDGPRVYFNTKNDPIRQLFDLNVVIKEKLESELNQIKYIDLRYGDYIFIL